ncbi:30S ribosomal protein S20, partial [Bacillus sp. HC-Mk]
FLEAVLKASLAFSRSLLVTKASTKLDKAARKGLIHQNAAARQKSRLAKQVNA